MSHTGRLPGRQLLSFTSRYKRQWKSTYSYCFELSIYRISNHFPFAKALCIFSFAKSQWPSVNPSQKAKKRRRRYQGSWGINHQLLKNSSCHFICWTSCMIFIKRFGIRPNSWEVNTFGHIHPFHFEECIHKPILARRVSQVGLLAPKSRTQLPVSLVLLFFFCFGFRCKEVWLSM
jgi:hypothetical protein